MKSVSSFELRDNLSSYLDLVVSKNKEIEITKYGKPIAKVVPYNQEYSNSQLARKYFGAFKDDFGGLDGLAYTEKIRRNKLEKESLNKIKDRNLN
ncbi:MAG: type II toxin-antitoxin system prevent-host-death family antitoxin [bacterium]|jgi:prevent-host-death family protein|nr:type II toxin-antitoxin system prevent-host-death family antitoxin [bacterium]